MSHTVIGFVGGTGPATGLSSICCWKEGALWRPCHTIADAAEPCGWAGVSHKTNHLKVKGCVGH